MKTLFLFLSIFLIVSFETAFAVCKIDKKAAPVVEKYRITLQEEIAAIQSEITSKSCGKGIGEGVGDGFLSTISGGKNSLLGNKNFVISSEFTIFLLKQGTPNSAILRDARMLERQTNTLQNLITQSASTCSTGDAYTSKVYGGKTISEVIENMYSNHIEYLSVFKESVVGGGSEATIPSYGVDKNTLAKDLLDAYGPAAINECQQSDGAFKKVAEAFSKLLSNGLGIQNGTQTWVDAWMLLKGQSPGQAEKERKLLVRELARQGISSDGQKAILTTLKKYPTSSDGVGNFLSSLTQRTQSVGEVVVNQVSELIDSLDKDLDIGAGGPNNSIGTAKDQSQNISKFLEKTESTSNIISAIQKELVQQYTLQKSLIGNDLLILNASVNSLIEAHFSLQKAIKESEEGRKYSQQACTKQGENLKEAICEY